MTRQVVETAAALIIGNEILSGKVAEQNLLPLAQTLRALGIRLEFATILPDIVDTIAAAVVSASKRFGLVFTSGGVGPTHDDVTIDAVARALDRPVVSAPALEALIKKSYGDKCTDAHLRMARIPEGADLVTTRDVLWPTVRVEDIWVMPGVPEIFRMKLSILREHLSGPRPLMSRSIYTGIEESDLKPLLDEVVSRHVKVEVGSYPKWFDPSYKTKVTLDGDDADEVAAAESTLVGLLPAGEPLRIE